MKIKDLDQYESKAIQLHKTLVDTFGDKKHHFRTVIRVVALDMYNKGRQDALRIDSTNSVTLPNETRDYYIIIKLDDLADTCQIISNKVYNSIEEASKDAVDIVIEAQRKDDEYIKLHYKDKEHPLKKWEPIVGKNSWTNGIEYIRIIKQEL